MLCNVMLCYVCMRACTHACKYVRVCVCVGAYRVSQKTYQDMQAFVYEHTAKRVYTSVEQLFICMCIHTWMT